MEGILSFNLKTEAEYSYTKVRALYLDVSTNSHNPDNDLDPRTLGKNFAGFVFFLSLHLELVYS